MNASDPRIAEFRLVARASRSRSRSTRRRVVSLASWAFVRAYITTMRPYLLFISGVTGVLGLSLAPSIALGPAIAIFTALFLSYGFGQALTDCFQTDTDSLSSPYRPLVRGVVARRDVLLVSLVGLAGVGVVFTLGHRLNLLLVSVAVVGLATYTWFKRRWWGGPFYNAWIVASLTVIGYVSALGVAQRPLAWAPGMTQALLLSFFGYANFVLTGYFKDLSADRATGYYTFPVVFGFKPSVVVSDLLATATVASALFALGAAGLFQDVQEQVGTVLFFAAGAGMSLLAQLRLHRVRDEREAHRAISLVVHAYILLLSAVAS